MTYHVSSWTLNPTHSLTKQKSWIRRVSLLLVDMMILVKLIKFDFDIYTEIHFAS